MEKQSAGSIRKTHFLVGMLFTILFIFTAMFISKPIPVYAAGDSGTSLGQIMNLDSYSANEDDESTNEQAGYLYWAASSKRCGVMFYVVDEKGVVQTNGLIMDRAGRDEFGYYTNAALGSVKGIRGADATGKRVGGAILGAGVGSATTSIYWRDNVSPVAYSGGWQANGSSSMAYLMEQATHPSGKLVELEIKEQKMPCPNWAYFVLISGGGTRALEQLATPDTKWSVIIEPVSVNYMYTNNTFANDTEDATGMPWTAGSPMPVGATNENGWSPIAYIGTGYRLIDVSDNAAGQEGGGRYTYKLYNKQLPFSLCLSEDIEVASYAGGGYGAKATYTGLTSSVYRIGSARELGHEGIAMASIDITGFQIPPIHTYDSSKGTPGNTETPDPDNGTSGDCTIKKLYYTQELSSDGTILTEAKDYHPYTQTSTTAYISIDTESEYEIEGWKTSKNSTSLNTKEQFDSITPTHKGTSSQEILLDQDTGEKYLYILYKKTEVNPNPPQPYDFQLQQSQITKRVSFMAPDANNTTQQLFTHSFTWTAPAPSKTSCTANSNKGHLKCTTSEHTHSDSCYTEDADGNESLTCTTSEHTHTDSCYEKCSSWKWTDNTTSLGITLDTSSINKAVVSKNDSITYNQPPAVNTITTSNKYYKDNTSTRSGTSQNTQSISNFNYITVLFRGQDHLTLADWKNGGAISYLTSLAYDSAYNFKSANTPQGTRKSGTEYNETFATRFINRSPDMSTTYKATVGSAGICSTTSSSYRFNTSTALTINGIVVNDPVGFIFLHIFRKSNNGRLP